MTPGAPTDAAVRELAAEVLARPEYSRFRMVQSQAMEDFLRWLAGLLERLDSLWVTDPLLYVALLGGLLLLAALLLTHVVWSVRVALRTTAPLPGPRRPAPGPDLAAEAHALAESSRFLEAAHTLQLACLGAMIQGGAIELARHEPNRTLRERLADARLPEAERRDFMALLGRLEARWFRDQRAEEGDRELFAAWRDLHRRIRAVPA